MSIMTSTNNNHHVRFSVAEDAKGGPDDPLLPSGEDNNAHIDGGGDNYSGTSPGKFGSTALRGNLTREQRNRDPLFYYEVVSVLGVGSMGSVAKVRKKSGTIGGSARKELQDHFRKTKRLEDCFRLPLVGGMFQYCLKGFMTYQDSDTDFNDSLRSGGSRGSSILQPRAKLVEDYNDQHGELETSYEMVYAMKSIHLSRVTDDVFVQELRNEIEVLKTLDHPQ